jgi:prepilin-type N-terminal cleavage/methylation domain-containing protein
MTQQQPRRTQKAHDLQSGFTIVELLIATVIFSMVTLVVVYGVLSFTDAYYGGVNSSTTQDTARSMLDTVTQAIEFSGEPITTTTPVTGPGLSNIYYFCAGGSTYYFDEGYIYNSSPSATNPGLYMSPGGCTSTPTSFSNGRELLGSNMRITYLSVTQSAPTTNPALYTVVLSIAYGDSDLLCNASKDGNARGGGCLSTDALNTNSSTLAIVGSSTFQGGPENDVQCRQTTGSQFCAHAGLSTTVSLRVGDAIN